MPAAFHAVAVIVKNRPALCTVAPAIRLLFSVRAVPAVVRLVSVTAMGLVERVAALSVAGRIAKLSPEQLVMVGEPPDGYFTRTFALR